MKAALIAFVLLFLAVANVGVAQLPSGAEPNGLGVQIHAYDDGTFPLVQAAGVKFVREDMTWWQVEWQKGVYDFTYQDAFAKASAVAGTRILWSLDYSNSFYGDDYSSAAWQQAFTNFSRAAAAHFAGSNCIWEIWNEPDNFGPIDANSYMALANQVVPAVRQAYGSGATIIGPAVDPTHTSFLTPCLQQGLLNLVDAVSVHPYRATAPETVVTTYANVRSLMQTYGGKTLPIVSSEWGYSRAAGDYSTSGASNPAQLQGDYLARSFLVNLSQNIPLSSWYDFRDDVPSWSDYEQNFGTVSLDESVIHPAYRECQLLTHSLSGETYNRKLNDGHTSDWLLVFRAPNGNETLAAWTTGNPRTVNVSGWGTLQLTSTPFYVNPTLLPGDANLDGRVDVLDLAILAANYRKQVTGGWMQADFNNDGVVDVADLALLAANYRHSYASDVVPAFDGLDAEAIQLLSQAGLTVVPEPGPLAMLAVVLIGALANTWRQRR